MPPTIHCETIAPGLPVEDIPTAVDFYTNKLGFTLAFLWNDPPDFAGVTLGKVSVHLYKGKTVPHVCSVYFTIDDADQLFDYHRSNGATVLEAPEDRPYGMRDYKIADPYGNILGFGHFIQHMGPALPVKRVDVPVRLEKRLAGLVNELAQHKNMSVSSLLEETLLHTFEVVGDGVGVASPHTFKTHQLIQELKVKYGIDYDTHASYRFVEE